MVWMWYFVGTTAFAFPACTKHVKTPTKSVCACVLFICLPVAFFNACHFPVDDVVESKAMMIDVPTVCSLEYFKRCGVCFFESGCFLPKQPKKDLRKKQVISSPFSSEKSKKFNFRNWSDQLLNQSFFPGCWGGGLIFGTKKKWDGKFSTFSGREDWCQVVSHLVRNFCWVKQ